MKKLTPFQKKVSRWYSIKPEWFKAIIVAFMYLGVIACFCLAVANLFRFSDRIKIDAIVNFLTQIMYVSRETAGFLFAIGILFCIMLFVGLLIYTLLWLGEIDSDNLPESAIPRAKELINNHLRFTDKIIPLIEMAQENDDGLELNEMLEEIDRLLDLEKNLGL